MIRGWQNHIESRIIYILHKIALAPRDSFFSCAILYLYTFDQKDFTSYNWRSLTSQDWMQWICAGFGCHFNMPVQTILFQGKRNWGEREGWGRTGLTYCIVMNDDIIKKKKMWFITIDGVLVPFFFLKEEKDSFLFYFDFSRNLIIFNSILKDKISHGA